jgi:hypothetical protein
VHRVADSFDLAVQQGQSAGDIESTPGDSLGDRVAHPLEKADSPKYRLLVHWPEERACADTKCTKPAHCLVGVEGNRIVQHYAVDPIYVLGVWGLPERKCQPRHVRKQLVVARSHPPLARDKLFEPFQLGETQCRLNIGHAEVPAEFLMDKTPASGLEAQIAQAAAAFGKEFIIGDQHAALAGGEMLVGVEAEDADVAETAAGKAFIGLTVHLGRVLDDFEPMPFGQFKDGFHVDWQPVNMHHHYRPCSGRYRSPDSLGRHVPGARIAIDHNGGGAGTDDGRGARDDRESRQDDLVARGEPEGRQGRIKRRATVAHRYAEAAFDPGSEPLLELRDKRPLGGNPAGADALGQVLFFIPVEKRGADLTHLDLRIKEKPGAPRQLTRFRS